MTVGLTSGIKNKAQHITAVFSLPTSGITKKK